MFGNQQQSARAEEIDKQIAELQAEAATEKKENEAPFYCPGCGRRAGYQKACVGSPTAPHPPIEVVSTDELSGDAADHTPAPSSE